MSVLTLELIIIFAAPELHVPASVWMGLAAIICEKAKRGEGQIALRRLLNSNSAKLASTVVDGPWKEGLYPESGETNIAAGLVWLTLGSPSAACRWRAAHSVRSFARLGKWEVIDGLIGRLHSTDVHPFQAPELPFYFLHARLWLLGAIARVAMDHPLNVAKYAEALKVVALDKSAPHVLMRHFAAQALLICASRGSVVLSKADAKALKNVNESPFPKKKSKEYPRNDLYQGRPESMPGKEPDFHLDYDFDKYDVTGLSDMFGRSRWETKDALTTWVHKYDPSIRSMYENGGRSRSRRDHIGGMAARYSTYGQQLGWHALNLVAGEFLSKYPVVQRPYDGDDSWREWLRRKLLTRNDGLWLADGVDRPPVDAQVNLYEKGEKALVLTGDKARILALLKIESSISEEVVVAGDWPSADGIGIHITSALVPPRQGAKLALQLAKEDPFRAWLPRVEEDEDQNEYSRSEREPFKPWIVWPSTEARLDETDPLGVNSAVRRLHFTKDVNAIRGLVPLDPFNRTWADLDERVAALSQAWGRNMEHDGDEAASAERLICRSDFLKDVLLKRRAELLILIVLRRYDKGIGGQDSQYWHTTAVIRIHQALDFEYYAGVINKLHVMKY